MRGRPGAGWLERLCGPAPRSVSTRRPDDASSRRFPTASSNGIPEQATSAGVLSGSLGRGTGKSCRIRMREGAMKDRLQVILLPLGMIAVLGLFVFVERNPVWFANTTYLGAILALQIAFVGLAHYEDVFLPLLVGTFLWAGSSLPFSETGNSLRWLFLAAGALGGFVIWIRSPRPRHFGSFHLVASLCVLSALVSAMVSEVPKTA